VNTFWWQLPGPSRYLARIADDLRAGKNALLLLPEYFPDRLHDALAVSTQDLHWSYPPLLPQAEEYPLHFLFSYFIPDTPSYVIPNVETLAKEQSFCGKVIWLEGMTTSSWPQWKEFLQEYQHVCSKRRPLERTVFCLPLVGELAVDQNLPPQDTYLAYHPWQGKVDSLDMFLFVYHFFQGKPLPNLQKRIAVAIAAGLALWDPNVAVRFADENIENILSPLPALREISRERGWNDFDQKETAQSWLRGVYDTIDGRGKFHSAALVHNASREEEIKRRIWSAEISVLFPMIEEKRQDILAELKDQLRGPFQIQSATINDPNDLEIGHLWHLFLTKKVKPRTEMRLLVERLWEMRNSLAHLEPIRPELLLCEEMNTGTRHLL